MRKKILMLAVSALASSGAMADSLLQVGVGYHSETLENDFTYAGYDFTESYEASALALSARYLFADHFGIEGTYYLEGDVEYTLSSGGYSQSADISGLSTSGTEINFLLGTSMVDEGFYVYTGLGYFSDKWEYGSDSETYSGVQIPFGAGYNFESGVLEIQYAARDGDAYEENGVKPTADAFSIRLMANL